MADFNILDEVFFGNPYPTLAALRRDSPCWYDARLDAHIVTRYHDIEHVLQDGRFSAERVAQFSRGAPESAADKLAVYNRELERWLLFRDPPGHTRLRDRLGRAVGSHLLPTVRQTATAVVANVIADLSWIEKPDLVRDLAYPVPTRILAHLLGVDQSDIARFKQWTTDIFALIGAGIADENAVELGYRGVMELRAYVLELLLDRREHPRDDLLSVLARPQPEPDGSLISDDDIVGLFMTTIVAGHETTTNLIANSLHAILSDAHSREWVLDHHGISEGAVDELVRYDGPVFSLIRRARRDVTITGKLVRAGECVFSMLNAGNRDPRKFSEPDRLDFDRPRPTHLGFGVGMHACLGAMIARAIVREVITEFLAAHPNAAIAPGCIWLRNMSIRGLASFPVELGESAAARRCRVFAAGLIADHAGIEVDVSEAVSVPLRDLAENRPRRVNAVVRASDPAAVREVVLAANEHGVALYPISTGKNWGLGSRSPVVDGGILLELGRMNRIRELDLEHGLAMIEPGVTQGALADRLVGSPYFLNVTTSCRNTSVLGNALDGGQGMIRLRRDELLGLEVVLGDGTMITTGSSGPSDALQIFGYGAGADATRVFCQSSLGVVTAGTIALVPRPEATSYAYATFSGEMLPAVVDRLAGLLRQQVIGHIFYFSEMQIDGQSQGLPDFSLLGPVLGRRRLVGEVLAIVREELQGVRGCKDIRTGEVGTLEPGDPLYHRGRMFVGIPSCEPLRARFGTTTCSLDDASRHGWSVLQNLLPLDGRSVQRALAVLAAGARAHGVAIQPHLSMVSSRSMNLMTMIWFQRSTAGIERMRALRELLQAELLAQGFPPSRQGIDMLHAARAQYPHPRNEALSRLKASLDPNGVVAPGRYV